MQPVVLEFSEFENRGKSLLIDILAYPTHQVFEKATKLNATKSILCMRKFID